LSYTRSATVSLA